MGLFERFPYTNFHELNAGWMLEVMKRLEEAWEQFTAGNSLSFADPLTYDATKSYAKNTIVLDGNGNAYISLQAVPKGVAPGNQDYWLMVFDYEAFMEKVNKNFTGKYYRDENRAKTAMAVGDWLTFDDVLCKASAPIAVDDLLEVGVNIEHFTLEDFIKAFMLSANQLIQQYKNDIDASELAYRQQLANDISTTTSSLQAQLDAAISGATVDSEVINARVGADGVTYDDLGSAIRTQLSNHVLIDITADNLGQLWAPDGTLEANSSFNCTGANLPINGDILCISGHGHGNCAGLYKDIYFTAEENDTTYLDSYQLNATWQNADYDLEIPVPAGAKYFRMNFTTNVLTKFAYSFKGGQKFIDNETATQKMYDDLYDSKTFEVTAQRTGANAFLDQGIKITANSSFDYSDPIPVMGSSLTIYGYCQFSTSPPIGDYFFYASEDLNSLISKANFSNAQVVGQNIVLPVTIPEGANYIRFNFGGGASIYKVELTTPALIDTILSNELKANLGAWYRLDLDPFNLISKILNTTVSYKIKLLGDSITAGVGGTGFNEDGQAIMTIDPWGGVSRTWYVNTSGHCWANELKSYIEDKTPSTVYNFGCEGIAAWQVLNNISTLVEDDDDLIILMIGTNNRTTLPAEYTSFIVDIIEYCKSANKPIIVMSCIPASVANEENYTRMHMEDIDMMINLACKQTQVPYISVYKLFIEYCKYMNITIDSLLADGLHPNDNGYDVMFYLIANALGISTKRPDATW